ncbi:MAG TPA: polyisoprenoid-binding protein, partial [Chitinophagaceae bacterium]|nr:polyisoprenoid-binding protein [Chitinophagaceae bacterium]
MVSVISKIRFAVFITVFGVFTTSAQNALMWKLDKSHTSVNFSINHFFSAVTGKFKAFDGNFQFDPNNLQS